MYISEKYKQARKLLIELFDYFDKHITDSHVLLEVSQTLQQLFDLIDTIT